MADRETLKSEVDFLTTTLRRWCGSKANPTTTGLVIDQAAELTRDNQNAYAEKGAGCDAASILASPNQFDNLGVSVPQ